MNEDIRNYRGWYEQFAMIKWYQDDEESRNNICITRTSLSWFPVVVKKQKSIKCQVRRPENFLVHWAGAHWQTDEEFIRTGMNDTSKDVTHNS
jgi:hypothetical protein